MQAAQKGYQVQLLRLKSHVKRIELIIKKIIYIFIYIYIYIYKYIYKGSISQLYGSTAVVPNGHLRFALKMTKFDSLPETPINFFGTIDYVIDLNSLGFKKISGDPTYKGLCFFIFYFFIFLTFYAL